VFGYDYISFYEEFHNLYSLSNITGMMKSVRMEWVGQVARIKNEKIIQNFSRQTSLRKPRRRWDSNFKSDLKDIGRELDSHESG
jgi:hypothetical protein